MKIASKLSAGALCMWVLSGPSHTAVAQMTEDSGTTGTVSSNSTYGQTEDSGSGWGWLGLLGLGGLFGMAGARSKRTDTNQGFSGRQVTTHM